MQDHFIIRKIVRVGLKYKALFMKDIKLILECNPTLEHLKDAKMLLDTVKS